MQVAVYDTEMKKVGELELPDDVFGAEVKQGLLWEQVRSQLASRRRGTHKTKKRGEVSGGGAKPLKQKGSGQARQGSIRAPNHVGGGTVFGPQPRDYSYRLPKSARKAALRSVLSLRAKEGILVIKDFSLDTPKTKAMVEFFGRAELKSALFVDNDNQNLKLSVRNMPKAKFLPGNAVNVYDVLHYEKLVLTESVISEIVQKVRSAKTQEEMAA
jgi:large subunit ribosomal protein L4